MLWFDPITSVTIGQQYEEVQLLGTTPAVFQVIWDAAAKLTDDWTRFYTAISILEDLRPVDERQRQSAIDYVVEAGKALPPADESRLLFHLAWKMPELDCQIAANALDDLLKKYPFGKDYPADTIVWTFIAEAFSLVDTDRALRAANRQLDFSTRCRALINIARKTSSDRAKPILQAAIDCLKEQHPSFLVTQILVEVAQELVQQLPNEAEAILKKALNYDIKDERLVDAWLLYVQIAKAAAQLSIDIMVSAFSKAVKVAEQIGNPERAPHWLDRDGSASQFHFLLSTAASMRRLCPEMAVSVLKKACSASHDLPLAEFCQAVAKIAREAAKIDAPELAKDLVEKAERQLEKSEIDRKGSAYASSVASLAIATAFADPVSFDEALAKCLNYLSETSSTTSFLILFKLTMDVRDAENIDQKQIARSTINAAKQIEARSDRATALAQAAQAASFSLSNDECLLLTAEAIETAGRIADTARRCITLLSIVAATKAFAPAHANHAYEEAIHAALSLDAKDLRGLMQEFIDQSAINLVAAVKLAPKLPSDADRCTLLGQIARKSRESESEEAD